MEKYQAKFNDFIANVNKEAIYNSVIDSLSELQRDRSSTASLSLLFKVANYIGIHIHSYHLLTLDSITCLDFDGSFAKVFSNKLFC